MQEQRPVNVVIVGTGDGARQLLTVCGALADTRVVGLLDPKPKAASIRLAKDLGLPFGTDLREFGRAGAVDVIIDTLGDPGVLAGLEQARPQGAVILSGQAALILQHLAAMLFRQRPGNVVSPVEDKGCLGPRSERIIGQSERMREVYELIRQVAPTPTNVLLLGETGTGKDLVARTIHQMSGLTGKPFVSVNCTALSSSLAESELFGYRKGSFTGAEQDRKGLLEAADGGTLFLDEIGDMGLELQAKMLRFLQSGEIRMVGSTKVSHVRVRVIAATNRNLEEAVSRGEFRKDLFYRFNTFTILLPPLRERSRDIPYLAFHFLTRAEVKLNKKVEGISDEAMGLMTGYEWPGNVRELENVIERAAILCRGTIEPAHLPLGMGNCAGNVPKAAPAIGGHGGEPVFQEQRERVIATFEKKELMHFLKQAGGNVSEASRLSGIPRRTFYRKMRRHGLMDD